MANPAALIGMGISAVGGIADYFSSKNQLPGAKQAAQQAKRDLDATLAKAAKVKYKETQQERDIQNLLKNQRVVDLSPIQSLQAGLLEQAGEAGERSLMTMAPTLARQGSANEIATQQAEFAKGAEGYMYGAEGAKQREAGNVGIQSNALGMQAQMEQGLLNTAMSNESLLQGRKASAIPDALGNVASFAALLGKKEGEGEGEGDEDSRIGGRVKYQQGGQIPEELLQQIMAENQGRGGEQPMVQKTEGEFDHDTNKKAIVDEETGEKEGEATGGEYILNPEQGDAIKSQYETIVQMIDNGDEPTLEELQNLFDAVHEVFSQPQFDEEAA